MDAVSRLRCGWTLHELVISLAVMGGVLALAAHAATGQLRFFHGVGEIAAVRGQLGQASTIATSLLWGVSPIGGDVVVAQDSALELRVTIGTAVTCESTQGRVAIPAGVATRGNALAAFVDSPEADDAILAFLEDSLGATWLTLRVASAPANAGGCPRFPSVSAVWTLDLREPLTVPPGTALRFTRPLRLSLYRASDGRWYLGARDWNGASQRFNIIQPVAGPLKAYSADPATTGFLFIYYDAVGEELPQPTEPSQIASVRIVTRGVSPRPVRMGGVASGASGPYEDSMAITVGLPNAR